MFAEIEGKLDLFAHDGTIRQSIPLVSALTHATEGFDPLAARDAILFESIRAQFLLDRGRLTTDDFKLDGPLRVVASGRFDFARPEREIRAELGIFLFRQVDLLLGKLPLIGDLIPGGKDRGLFGAYFEIAGTLDEPDLRPLPLRSLTEGTPLPELLKAPFSAIREALRGNSRDED